MKALCLQNPSLKEVLYIHCHKQSWPQKAGEGTDVSGRGGLILLHFFLSLFKVVGFFLMFAKLYFRKALEIKPEVMKLHLISYNFGKDDRF